MINKISSQNSICSCGSSKQIDEEHRQIIRRLYMVYGVRPTGNKTTDKALLRSKELEDAKQSSVIKKDLITVSPQEQEKIIEKKKEKEAIANPTFNPEEMLGQKLLGEQKMLAINMKKTQTKIV